MTLVLDKISSIFFPDLSVAVSHDNPDQHEYSSCSKGFQRLQDHVHLGVVDMSQDDPSSKEKQGIHYKIKLDIISIGSNSMIMVGHQVGEQPMSGMSKFVVKSSIWKWLKLTKGKENQPEQDELGDSLEHTNEAEDVDDGEQCDSQQVQHEAGQVTGAGAGEVLDAEDTDENTFTDNQSTQDNNHNFYMGFPIPYHNAVCFKLDLFSREGS